jgi:hypothetical protein
MKANLEAWQMGNEQGWGDGYYDFPAKTSFNFPLNWSEAEKEHYEKGYKEGYDEGQRDC